jgi:hypothetical protein
VDKQHKSVIERKRQHNGAIVCIGRLLDLRPSKAAVRSRDAARMLR